jgi:Leucine-rich repeat (LRR) protein
MKFFVISMSLLMSGATMYAMDMHTLRFRTLDTVLADTSLQIIISAKNKTISLDLHGKKLDSLSNMPLNSNALMCITHLDLSDNRLMVVPFCIFQACPSLKDLNVRHNRIDTVETTDLTSLDTTTKKYTLEKIDLTGNNMRAFSNISNLLELCPNIKC